MTKCTLVVAAALALLAGCSQPMSQLGGQNSANLSEMDNNFFKMITIGNMTEIDSSQLALTQSQNEQIRTFAQQMITDHTMAENKVSSLASEKGVTPPSRLDEMHQKMVDALKDKQGADFDKAYAELQVTAHKEVITLDENEANSGNDPQVKALAQQLLPILQMHLKMAKQLPGV